MPKFRNSEYTVEFKYRRLLEPRSESELAAIIKNANQEGRKIKIVGGSHSFSHIGKTDDTLVDLSKISEFCSLIDVDQNEKSAVLGGGMQLGDAIEALHAHDLHFPSLGSWYSQTIGGALATAVHGSSLEYGTLSDLVEELWAITASGDSIHLKNNDSGLAAWRVSLGLLGVVTKGQISPERSFLSKK